MASENHFRVGIVGAARIAKKNCRAAENHYAKCSVSAIASRSKQKGLDFAHEIFVKEGKPSPLVIGGENAYNELISDHSLNLDAVYIPLPTKLHEPFVTSALSSGKHVLLEKPVATSAESYRRMLETAAQNGKFLMDGTMFHHHPRTAEFVKSIPTPNRIHFNFTFDGTNGDFMKEDIRIKCDGDFMGCVGDLGWYCVRMGLLVFSGLDAGSLRGLVTDVQVIRYQLNEEGVPIDIDCMVYFTENRVLSFHCSFLHPLNQTVQIFGSGAIISSISTDSILPYEGETLSFSLVKQYLTKYDEICQNEDDVVKCDNNLVQEVMMWHNFARWARAIDHDSSSTDGMAQMDVKNEIWWGGNSLEVNEANAMASYSLHTQIVLDAVMESILHGGVKTKVDS